MVCYGDETKQSLVVITVQSKEYDVAYTGHRVFEIVSCTAVAIGAEALRGGGKFLGGAHRHRIVGCRIKLLVVLPQRAGLGERGCDPVFGLLGGQVRKVWQRLCGGHVGLPSTV